MGWVTCYPPNAAHELAVNAKSPVIPARGSKAKNPAEHKGNAGFFFITSLTITYFHTGCSTIIGAESFHGPVRDGKGWD